MAIQLREILSMNTYYNAILQKAVNSRLGFHIPTCAFTLRIRPCPTKSIANNMIALRIPARRIKRKNGIAPLESRKKSLLVNSVFIKGKLLSQVPRPLA